MAGLTVTQRPYYWKVSYTPEYERVHIYSSGCNFACRGCPYSTGLFKIEGKILSIKDIKRKIKALKPKIVCFLGGEPTINPNFPDLVEFTKSELNAHIRVMTNGSNPLPKGIDAASISIKAYTSSLHEDYTGRPNASVLKNFIEIYRSGIEVRASSVFIPNYIGFEEIEKISKFIAEVDPAIPYHIIGFIPYGNVPWRAPTIEEIKRAASIARKYLKKVTWSLPNPLLKDYPSTLPDSELEYKFKSIRVL